MNTFFNKYNFRASASFSQILEIAGSEDLLLIGKYNNGGLICRIKSDGNIIWEKLYQIQQASSFSKGIQIRNGDFIVLGSALINGKNNKHHIVFRIKADGNIVWSRQIATNSTRNSSLRIVPLNNQEYLISGWNIGVGGEKMEFIRIDLKGNLTYSYKVGFNEDDRFSDVISFGNEILFVGGTNKLSKGDGFLMKTDYNLKSKQAKIIQFPNGNQIIEELDAVSPISSTSILLAGNALGNIFVVEAQFSKNRFSIQQPFVFRIGRGAKVRKILYLSGYTYVLFYDKNTEKHYIAKLKFNTSDTKSQSRKNRTISLLWVKFFDVRDILYITDIIGTRENLYLAGFYNKTKQPQAPVFIKTDHDLNCCLSKENQRVESSIGPNFRATDVSPIVEGLRSNSLLLKANSSKISSSVELLCPPDSGDPRNCPLAFVAWNSLKPRARSRNFDRALKAEVRDAFWMLSRQWQWGEFNGIDGGSIVSSKLSLQTTQLNRYTQLTESPKNKSYNKEIPLEFQVEKIRPNLESNWMAKMEIGQYWLKLLKVKFATQPTIYNQCKQFYISVYTFNLPTEPSKPSQDDYSTVSLYEDALNAYKNAFVEYHKLVSNEDYWQTLTALNGRSPEGLTIVYAVYNSGLLFPTFLAPTDLNQEKDDLMNWFYANYGKDYFLDSPNAWSDRQLEYQFETRAPAVGGEPAIKLKGKEYPGGQLDWYSVDINPTAKQFADDSSDTFTPDNTVVKEHLKVLIPSKITFPGMPNARWWEMEESAVDFGNMYINTTDISKLLLLDFIVNYANNWYIIPHQEEVGSLINLEGIEVKDNFGIRTLITTANKTDQQFAAGPDFRGWSMYTLATEGDLAKNDTRLFLAPVAPNILEGKPIEKINFIRDEMANMVWGIEQIIPNGMGSGMDGYEASINLQKQLKATIDSIISSPQNDSLEDKPKIKYLFAQYPPENWIPFIPVNVTNSVRSIKLQRAKMPRNIGEFDNNILPRTHQLLKVDSPYFINEEEMPKAGRIITSTWQRTRWINGKTFIWLGKQKKVGRGGGSSGLKFDQLTSI